MTDRELLEKLLQEVVGMKQEMVGVQQEVVGMKQELVDVKVEVSSVKALATKIQIILENDVSKKINVLFEGHQQHNEKLDDLIEVTQDIQSSVLANEIVTKSNLRDIAALKKKAQ